MSIDGTCLDAADTPANDEAFGRPGTGRGSGNGAFPQVRMVGLAECGTHAISTAAAMGHYRPGRPPGPGLLSPLVRGCWCWPTGTSTATGCGHAAAGTGAELCWRTKANHVLPVAERLADGSFLSMVYGRGARASRHRAPEPVRVIEYGVDDGRADEDTLYRLITTILDPAGLPRRSWRPCIRSAGSSRPPWMS